MTQGPSTRSWKGAGLRIGGSAVILGLLFVLLPFQELVAALKSVPLRVWVVSLMVYMTLHLIGVFKWRLLVNAAGGQLLFRNAIRCYYSGLFGNTFLPSIVGGDIIRAGLALRLSGNKGAVLFGSLVDRTLDILGLGLVAGIGALMLPNHLDGQSRTIFVGLMVMFLVGGVGALAIFRTLPARRFSRNTRRRLVKGRRAIGALARRPGHAVAALLLGMTLQTLLTALCAWMGRSVGIDIPFEIWLFVWPLAKVSGVVPVTQGGIGIREAAQVALFAPFGVGPVPAMAAGLIFEGVIISGGLLGGFIALVIARVSRGPQAPVEASHTLPNSGGALG